MTPAMRQALDELANATVIQPIDLRLRIALIESDGETLHGGDFPRPAVALPATPAAHAGGPFGDEPSRAEDFRRGEI